MFASPGSIAFTIGPIEVRYYGILIALGILAALFVGSAELKRRKMDPEVLYDLGFWAIISGILGARLYYVLFQWHYYRTHLAEIPAVWNGGLAIHGALIGGFLGFLIFVKIKKLVPLLYLDVMVPGIALAQAVGRWGNFFNSEAFGTPTSFPWKLYIPFENRPAAYVGFEYFHPTFLYESLWNLLVFCALTFLLRKLNPAGAPGKVGMIFFLYLLLYSVGRFFIEGIRTDSLYFGPFRAAQLMSVALFAIGIIGCVLIAKKNRSA